MRRSIWPVLVFAVLGFLLLLALGIWQVQRLAWKEGLIAAIDASIAGPAITLQQARQLPNIDYAKVRLDGEFRNDAPILMIATADGGPAWSVIRAFALGDGTVLMVDTGKLRDQAPPQPPAGAISLEALVRLHAGRQGMFDPDNKADGSEWYWWDLPAMARRLGATEQAFTLQLLPGQPGTEGLIVEPPKANLHNNHLGYAITWFGLAATLVVMAGLFLLRLRREAANGTQ